MKRRVSTKLVLLFFALAVVLAAAPAAFAQPGEFVKGVLQPLADGFPKKPITFIVVDDPGSRDDIYAKTLQEALRGISPVPIAVSDEQAPTFGTFYTIRDTMGREGGMEGYFPIMLTVWGAATDTLAIDLKKELGLGLEDMNMVAVTESIPYCMVQRKGAPWGNTWADFLKYAKANPGKIRKICDGVGSGSDIAGDYVLDHHGIKTTKIPQPSARDALAAVGAGAGDIAFQSSPVVQPHYEAGRVDILAIMGPSVPAPWNQNPKILSLAQLGIPNVALGSVLGFCVPKDVPKAHSEWLFKLIKAGASTDLYKKREKQTVGTTIQILNPDQANALKNSMVKFAEPVVRSLGLHWDQAK